MIRCGITSATHERTIGRRALASLEIDDIVQETYTILARLDAS